MIPTGAEITSGPIFLDQLLCTESDSSLQECDRHIRTFGFTSCNHSQDVWIRCRGMILNRVTLGFSSFCFCYTKILMNV